MVAAESRFHRDHRSFSSGVGATRRNRRPDRLEPAGYPLYLPNSSVALVPPNPKELDMAKFTVALRAVFGT